MTEEATIRRGERNARYTTVPNHVFEDVRLSMEARWLLGYLLSKPDNWTVRMGDIRKKGSCGRDKARAMISELVDAGYMEREDARKAGKFNGLMLVIYDEPRGENAGSEASVASLPQTEKPATVEPATANPPLVKTEGLATPENSFERERGREPEGLTKRAEALFWKSFKVWDRFDPSPKQPMLSAWAKLTWEQMQAAGDAVPRYLAGCRAEGMRHAPAISSYLDLSERLWESYPPVEKAAAVNVEAKPFGPWWMAARLKSLLRGPTMTPAGLTSFERSMVADGKADEGELMRAKIAKTGWPTINAMHDRAANRQGVTVATALEHLAAMMEPVPVGSEIYVGWRALHEARGWPWLPDPGDQRVVYFPAGGPEALDAFEAAIRGNQNDAGGREAAE